MQSTNFEKKDSKGRSNSKDKSKGPAISASEYTNDDSAANDLIRRAEKNLAEVEKTTASVKDDSSEPKEGPDRQ